MSFVRELKRRNVVRMALFYLLGAWVVLQVADVVVGVAGLPDWTLRLVGLVLLLGLPLALVLSWVYKLTPEGLKKDSAIDESGREITVTPVQRLILVASFAAILAGGYVLIERFLVEQHQIVERQALERVQRPPRTAPVTVAVLPVEFDGEVPLIRHRKLVEEWTPEIGEDDEYLDPNWVVRNLLSSFGDIRMLPQQRIEELAETDMAWQQIAHESLATHVLRPTMHRSGESTLISLELLDAEAGERIWALAPERPLVSKDGEYADLAVTGEIVFELGKALAANDLTELAADTDDPLAFEAFYRGRYADWGPSHREEVERWFREAVMLDPEFADAYAYYAFFKYVEVNQGRPWSEIREETIELAERAIKLNPNSAQAQASMARVLIHEGDYDKAREHGYQAVLLAPRDPSIREDYWRTLWAENLWDEVIEQMRIAETYAPGRWDHTNGQIPVLVWAGRVDEAESYLAELQEKFPERNFDGVKRWIYVARDQWKDYLDLIYQSPDRYFSYLRVMYIIGALDSAEAWAREFVSRTEGEFQGQLQAWLSDTLRNNGKLHASAELARSMSSISGNTWAVDMLRTDFARLSQTTLDPETRVDIEASIDQRCDFMESTWLTEEGLVVPESENESATICLVHSVSVGKTRTKLGESLLDMFRERGDQTTNAVDVDFTRIRQVVAEAAMGNVEQAMAVFRELDSQGFSYTHYFDFWRIRGHFDDLYHGLASQPEFVAMVNAMEEKNTAIRAEIEAEAPWLLDPRIPKPEAEPQAEAVASG